MLTCRAYLILTYIFQLPQLVFNRLVIWKLPATTHLDFKVGGPLSALRKAFVKSDARNWKFESREEEVVTCPGLSLAYPPYAPS